MTEPDGRSPGGHPAPVGHPAPGGHRPRRRVGAVLVLVAVLAGVAAAATTTATVTAPPALAQGSGATTDCSGRLEVLLLMDESASLATTDPDDKRVAAAEVLVQSLAASAAASNGTVNLTIAGFGTEAGDIGRVTLPADEGAAIGVVRGFADRNTDVNTDYVLALRYAANHFANFPDVPVACKRMVWFTDGAYSIDDPQAPGIISYTRATSKGVIESQLEGQLCGPLPPDAVTTVPISQQIQSAGFVVQLLDFRVEGVETAADRAERAATTPVIDRLLAGPPEDSCRVPGGRVLASQAADLATEFFTQGQIAAGRQPLDCAVLDGGYPAAVVQSLTVRNAAPAEQVSIALDGKEVAKGQGFATWSPADGPPRGGTLSVSTAAGSASGCYAALSATAAVVGDGSIFADATSSLLRLTVYAGGPEGDASPQGPEAVVVTATVNGVPAQVAWDETTRTWEVFVAGPVAGPPELVVSVTAPGWGGELARIQQTLGLRAEPPLPTVVWAGPTTLEGPGTFAGSLRVTPSAVTGGSVCISVGEATIDTTGVAVAVPGGDALCGSDAAPFDLDADIVVEGSRNDSTEIALPFTASYTTAGADAPRSIAGEGQVQFRTIVLTRVADPAKEALITTVLVLISALVPLGILLFLLNRQRRLPDPTRRQVARVSLTSRDGRVHRTHQRALAHTDFFALTGTRKRWSLPLGLEMRRERTFNPFATTSVVARNEKGPFQVFPSMASPDAHTMDVPASFEFLVLITTDPVAGTGTAVVVTPAGASPAEADQAVDDALEAGNMVWSRVSGVMGRLATI